MLQLASFLFLGHNDFSQKIIQDPLFFAPFLTNKIPGRKLIASAKYQTETTGNDGVSHKDLGILPDLFHGWSTTRPLHKKKYPYTVLYYSTEPLYYSTLNKRRNVS